MPLHVNIFNEDLTASRSPEKGLSKQRGVVPASRLSKTGGCVP